MWIRLRVRPWPYVLALVLTGPLWAAEPAPPSAPLRALVVHPAQILLDGPRAQQRLVVLGEYADGSSWDLTRKTQFEIKPPGAALVDAGGLVTPLANGRTTVLIRAGGQAASVPVQVRNATAETPVDFSREVVPLLTKAGCNQGACHGAQMGRGGFRLSLLGYDPLFDYGQIVESAEGRRVVPSDPERSILLLKPTLQMEHGGGERFSLRSNTYVTLKRWLEDGAPEPKAGDPAVTALEAWPAHRIMFPGEQQQLAVRATWSDGRAEDVTSTAQYDPLNEAVAAVTPAGLVTAKSAGETHVMIRFAGQAIVMQVTLPYERLAGNGKALASSDIDRKVAAKWRELGLMPSPPCTDEEFFRRIHLDTIGTLPAPADIRAFLVDKSPDKRSKAIDRVLERPEYVDFWTLKWGDLLRISRDQLGEKGMWSFTNWVRAALRDNKPVDEFVRELITAEGSTFTDGPANFYRTANNPADWSENAAQLFLGVRLQCARCHHHPFEKWSQDDYYGMAAFFVRLGTKRSQDFGLFGNETVIYLRPNGDQFHPRKGTLVKPHPLDGTEMDDPFDRRRKLAEWLTARENRFFSRNIVNRFWSYYMGRGLVEPPDDLRATNPASNPELLDALADDFAGHHFDLKHLLRTIMNSRAYQLSSAQSPGNAADRGNIYCARYMVKRLTAEELADALDFATGTREKYQGLPTGTRAIQLPDTTIRSFFLDVFGRPARQVTCECERTTQPNMAQALHLLNGDSLNRKIAAPNGTLETLFKNKTSVAQIMEELYLTTVSRLPRPDEVARINSWLATAESPKEGMHDLLWVLLNSREFLFNH
jgi:hypothetical protein